MSLNGNNKEDEIDLFEILSSLWKGKFSILLIAAVATACSFLLAFSVSPTFQIKTVVREGSQDSFYALNLSGVYSVTPKEMLNRVGAKLDSYDARLRFFDKNQDIFQSLGETYEARRNAFIELNSRDFKLLKPESDAKKNSGLVEFVGLSLDYKKNLDGKEILKRYLEFVIDEERQRLAADVRSSVDNSLLQIERRLAGAKAAYESQKSSEIVQLEEGDQLRKLQLNDELAALREKLRTLRQNRISQLNEAIAVASSLKILKPSTPSDLSEASKTSNGSMIKTEVNNQQVPLYFLGVEALSAELKALRERRTDDFTSTRIAEIAMELKLLNKNRKIETLKGRQDEELFLSTLSSLREEAAKLKALNFDFNSMSLVTIELAAEEPKDPIKPKKSLIIVIGCLLGFLLGVLYVMISSAIRSRRNSDALSVKEYELMGISKNEQKEIASSV